MEQTRNLAKATISRQIDSTFWITLIEARSQDAMDYERTFLMDYEYERTFLNKRTDIFIEY